MREKENDTAVIAIKTLLEKHDGRLTPSWEHNLRQALATLNDMFLRGLE